MFKKISPLVLLLIPSLAFAGLEDRSSGITLKKGNYILLPQLSSAPTGNPSSGYGWAYNLGGVWYFENSAGTQVALASGSGDNTLDNSYDQGGAGAGRTITADTGAVTITSTDADTAYLLAITPTPGSSAALGGVQITSGANATQDSLNIVNNGSGDDIEAGNGVFKVSKTGAITGLSTSVGSLTATGNIALGSGGDDTFAVTSTGVNISTAGAFTGVADITGTAGEAMTITVASDGAADDLTLSVSGATDSSVIVQSAGTGTDAVKLNATAGGVDIDSAAGADTNVAGGQVALVSKDNTASAISITTNIGTSETIVATNTQGTAEGAIALTSTAGGIDIDAAAAKNVDISGGQVLISSKDNAASAIVLTTNTGTNETIVVTNTQGTSANAITLAATTGGVNIDAAAALDVDIAGGQVLISSKDNAASAIALTANVGTSETIAITNTKGTDDAALNIDTIAGGIDIDAAKSINIASSEAQADAIVLDSSAGGVDISSAATYDIDLTATGGTIQVIASEAAANQFKVDAQGTVADYAIVLETTDGGVQINADGAANGDISVDAGDDLSLTAAGNLNYTITGTVDYNGSSLTDTRDDFENVATANTVTSAECNKTFFLNNATEFASVLPTASGLGGCRMRFVVGAAPSGANYTITTGNSLENLIYGVMVVNGSSVACAQEDTITFTDGAAVKGDWIEFENDNTSWYISGVGAGAGAITCTQTN